MTWSHRQSRIQRLSLLGMAVVFLLQTLAWSAMPVYASDASKGWVTLCTSEGIKKIFLADAGISTGDASQNTPSTTLVDHCDLCVFAQGLGMAPDPLRVFGAHAQGHVITSSATDRVVADASYTPQQPRAPPVSELI